MRHFRLLKISCPPWVLIDYLYCVDHWVLRDLTFIWFYNFYGFVMYFFGVLNFWAQNSKITTAATNFCSQLQNRERFHIFIPFFKSITIGQRFPNRFIQSRNNTGRCESKNNVTDRMSKTKVSAVIGTAHKQGMLSFCIPHR